MSWISNVYGFFGSLIKIVIGSAPKVEAAATAVISDAQALETMLGIKVGAGLLAKAADWNTRIVAIAAAAVKAEMAGEAAAKDSGANIPLDAVAYDAVKALVSDIRAELGNHPALAAASAAA